MAGPNQEDQVLISIRQIIRATDLHSRRLSKQVGLTAPQLLILQAIRDLGAVSISKLSQEVSLSQATVTTIIDPPFRPDARHRGGAPGAVGQRHRGR